MNFMRRIISASAEFSLIGHLVIPNSSCIGSFVLVCTVRPPVKRVEAIPLVAVATAIFFCPLIFLRMSSVTLVLPVPARRMKKGQFQYLLIMINRDRDRKKVKLWL